MSVAGLATEYLFKAAGLVPTVHPRTVVTTGFHLDATLVLNVVAIAAFVVIYWLQRNRDRFGGPSGYARDPVCGMQVEVAHAPAVARLGTGTYYFCCDRCYDRFVSEPQRYLRGGSPPPPPPATPVAVTLGRKPRPGAAAR
jgi:YHS domain-containing protein